MYNMKYAFQISVYFTAPVKSPFTVAFGSAKPIEALRSTAYTNAYIIDVALKPIGIDEWRAFHSSSTTQCAYLLRSCFAVAHILLKM